MTIPFIENSGKRKLIYSDRKETRSGLGTEVAGKRTEGQGETCGGDRCVCDLDRVNGLVGV